LLHVEGVIIVIVTHVCDFPFLQIYYFKLNYNTAFSASDMLLVEVLVVIGNIVDVKFVVFILF